MKIRRSPRRAETQVLRLRAPVQSLLVFVLACVPLAADAAVLNAAQRGTQAQRLRAFKLSRGDKGWQHRRWESAIVAEPNGEETPGHHGTLEDLADAAVKAKDGVKDATRIGRPGEIPNEVGKRLPGGGLPRSPQEVDADRIKQAEKDARKIEEALEKATKEVNPTSGPGEEEDGKPEEAFKDIVGDIADTVADEPPENSTPTTRHKQDMESMQKANASARRMEEALDRATREAPSTNSSRGAMASMGVVTNSTKDWFSFLLALATNSVITAACLLVFSVLRVEFRLVYAKNAWENWGYSEPLERATLQDNVWVTKEPAEKEWPTVSDCGLPLPPRPSLRLFNWIWASLRLRSPEVVASAGLDQAMLLQFTCLGMWTFGTIGVPMCLIMAPLHILLGGYAAGEDYLSWQGFGNVQKGSSLVWVHAAVVWMVVLTVDHHLYHCQEVFVEMRTRWLQAQSKVEACTILVEGIPVRYCTRSRLRHYFNEMFEGRDVVETVNVVVHTERLMQLEAERDYWEYKALKVRAQVHDLDVSDWFTADKLKDRENRFTQADDAAEQERVRLLKEMARLDSFPPIPVAERLRQEDEDSLAPLTDRSSSSRREAHLSPKGFIDGIKEMQESMSANLRMRRIFSRINSALPEDEQDISKTYCNAAFVTFKSRFDAELALRIPPYTPDREEFQVFPAPDPSDILYTDFMRKEASQKTLEWLGRLLIFGVFLVFLPTISFISAISNLNYLDDRSATIKHLRLTYPKAAGMWNGMAAATCLGVVLGFLPQVLMLIGNTFFKRKAHHWGQHALQKSYFVFLLVFQLLVVAFTKTLISTLRHLLEDPLGTFVGLSMGMCKTTNFFLMVFCVQCASTALEAIRGVTLLRYIFFRKICESPPDAAVKAEPEEEDFLGTGARMARYTAMFVIGVSFVSLCPLICIMGFIYFFLVRLVIGYQVVYAERRKPDLGGEFWVTAMEHCQIGLVIYILAMTGVLAERALTKFPAFIAGFSLLYMVDSIGRFRNKFHWKSISHEEIIAMSKVEAAGDAERVRQAARDTYEQRELMSSARGIQRLGTMQSALARLSSRRRRSMREGIQHMALKARVGRKRDSSP